MSEAFDDLLPLFLAEAAERLEKLGELISANGRDPDGVIQARRELHALKGAGRMMGLADFSLLCHRAESLLEDAEDADWREIQRIHRQLEEMADGTIDLIPSNHRWNPKRCCYSRDSGRSQNLFRRKFQGF